MKLFLLFITLLIITIWKLNYLVMQKVKRDTYVFVGLMAIAAYLSISATLGLYIPNPTKGIRVIFQPVAQFIQQLLNQI